MGGIFYIWSYKKLYTSFAYMAKIKSDQQNINELKIFFS
jgi:hypothetical protein